MEKDQQLLAERNVMQGVLQHSTATAFPGRKKRFIYVMDNS